MVTGFCDCACGKAVAGKVQVDVALVGNHVDAALVGELQDGGEVLKVENGATGIVGAVENDGASARRDAAFNHPRRKLESGSFVGLCVDAFAARILNDVFK